MRGLGGPEYLWLYITLLYHQTTKATGRNCPIQTAKHWQKQSGQTANLYLFQKRYLEDGSLRWVEQWGLKGQFQIWYSHTIWKCVIILTQNILIFGQANEICCVTKLKTTYPLDQLPRSEVYIPLVWNYYYLWASVGSLLLLNWCCW